MLDIDSYNKLMLVIDELSTFDGDYNSLINKPNISAAVEDGLFKIGMDAGTISEIYKYIDNMSDNIKSHIDIQIAQSELSYAEKVELYTTAESLQAYVENRINEVIKPWLNRDYATRSEIMAKSDKGHIHEINQISGLQPALDSKANISHNHAGSYAPMESAHFHNNISTLDKISDTDINKWNNISLYDTRLDALEHEIYEELQDKYLDKDDFALLEEKIEEISGNKHSHSNINVLNQLSSDKIDLWDMAQHSLGTEFNTGHWKMGKTTTATVGGISEGTNLDGLQISEILIRLLYPDKKP